MIITITGEGKKEMARLIASVCKGEIIIVNQYHSPAELRDIKSRCDVLIVAYDGK